MKTSRKTLTRFLIGFAGMIPLLPLHAEEDGQTRIKFISAKSYVEQFEAEVARAEGKPVGETYNKVEAMRRVAELMELYPEDERVLDFKKRLRTAILGGKGDAIEITKEMLAYLDEEEAALKIIREAAAKKWAELVRKNHTEAEKSRLAFPSLDPEKTDPAGELGATLILPGFNYEANVFQSSGKQWVAIGGPKEGFYYVDVSSRSFLECYEAVKRAKSSLLGTLPTAVEAEWCILARITGSSILVPGGGEGVSQAFTGWEVEPFAIWLPATLTAFLDENGKGTFAGEAELIPIRKPLDQDPVIPSDISPEDLIRLHLRAIKEKNWPLYLATVHDRLKATPNAVDSLRRGYDSTLRRLHMTFVHAEPFEVSPIRTLEGENQTNANLENLFLEEQDLADNKAKQGNHVEAVTVLSKLYNRQGRQVGSPHRTTLERSSALHGKRWMVAAGDGF